MFETIIWATDGSEAADRALPYAKALAEGRDGRLVVVHVKELLGGRAGGYPVLANEAELQAKIRHQVDELREAGLDATLKLATAVAPYAPRLIAEVARDVGADLIVVGTRGRSPIAELFLGSVTQRLLHVAPCPVLAIPAGKQAAADQPERELELAEAA
jgi:nucleotide-binding universal stress UspA family protein